MKQIKNSAEAHIILDCNTDKIYEVLKQAQQIGMMSDYHSYLITSLVKLSLAHSFDIALDTIFSYRFFCQDLQTINLDEFRYGGTNITAFRLVDPYSQLVQNTVREWTKPNTNADKMVTIEVKIIYATIFS